MSRYPLRPPSLSLVLGVALTLSLAAASAASAQAGRLSAFKGWEVYSWRAAEGWRFVLLYGTNRLKFCSEARNEAHALSLGGLGARLNELAVGQYVSLRSEVVEKSCPLAMPPAPMRAHLRRLCGRRHLHCR